MVLSRQEGFSVGALRSRVAQGLLGLTVTGAVLLGGASAAWAAPLPQIAVTNSATPTSRPAPDGQFTFAVQVSNPGTTPITINSLTDNVYDLTSRPGSTCALGAVLPAGGTYSCQFTGSFNGTAGSSQTDTVTATGIDQQGNSATNTGRATVTLTAAPPQGATVSVRPSSDVVARGARLRVAVKVRGATYQAIGDSVGGSVIVTLRPRVGGRAVRREVFVLPGDDGSRDVTIGLNVPRSAHPGRYGLSAVLFGEDGQTAYAHSASVLVRVR